MALGPGVQRAGGSIAAARHVPMDGRRREMDLVSLPTASRAGRVRGGDGSMDLEAGAADAAAEIIGGHAWDSSTGKQKYRDHYRQAVNGLPW